MESKINIDWAIMPKKEGSDRNIKGVDDIGNKYEGVAIVEQGVIQYIQDTWITSPYDQSGNGNHWKIEIKN